MRILFLTACMGAAAMAARAGTGSPTDWAEGNAIANGDFASGKPGALPDGWEAVCPNPALAPKFELVDGEKGQRMLRAAGNGRRECFGYVRHKVRLAGGKTWRMRVRLRFEGLEDINRHVVHGVFAGGYNDGIFTYRKEGKWVVGEGRFPGPAKATNAEVRLYFRFSAKGRAWWERVSLQECEAIEPRPVTIAVSWGRNTLAAWGTWLDRAGEQKADVALLPEMFNAKKPKAAEPMDGPSASLLSQKARQWKMYVSASFYERRGDLVLNTAPLFDRTGKLVGTYCKNQVYDPEEDEGVSPGIGFPVFEADFGRVGIIICYDSWFPETARLLAYKGAELVLFPNAGYFESLMTARAADNGIWIAVSSLNNSAGVWDSGGARGGQKRGDPTRNVVSSIRSWRKDDKLRMIVATVDLSRRWSPAWWGGPMRSAPGGRRCRQTLIEPIEDEIAREARRWWEE